MWHRLQILISKEHEKWLKRKSFESGKSIGEIIRDMVDKAMKKNG
jgi:hypothetical protein